MGVKEFIELFIKELEINHDLRKYYRLINSSEKFHWRKAYLEQRLKYVNEHLPHGGTVWDAGCGYGTTAIFLTLNGYIVEGNTLEFYYDKIRDRISYWSQFGNLDHFRVEYANLFDMPVKEKYFDAIIAQDTLHHLEPIGKALNIFSRSLKPGSPLVVTEENGRSIFIRMKNFKTRGFHRIHEYYDDQLQKSILFGNENARSLKLWNKLLSQQGFSISENETEYIRLFPHFMVHAENYDRLYEMENKAYKKYPLISEFLFFGINFTALQTHHTNEQKFRK